MASWQDDPIVSGAPAPVQSGGWKNDPIVGATAQTPSDNDYSKSPWSALARTFESSADWGTGDLLRALATGKKPSETAAQSSAAAASLPWYVRYPTEAAGYGLGLVNLLDPVTDAAEAGALGLGAGANLAKVAGTAAEGATVGGVSHIAGSDDPGLIDTAGAALGGAAIGGAAGAAAPLVNRGLTKTLGKAATVDPDAVVAATTAATQQGYTALRQITVPHVNADNAFDNVLNNLSASQKTGMKSMMGDINDIRNEINDRAVQQIPITGDDLNSWARQLKGSASTPIQGGVANDIATQLKGAVGAQGGAGAWDAAQEAARRQAAAESLKEYGQTIQGGGSLGQAPLTEAKRYYPDPVADKAQYDAMAGLANQGGYPSFTTSAIGHLGANALGAIGGGIAGFPGAFAGEALGYLYAKPAIYKAMKGYDKRQSLKGLQAVYPTLTGQQPTGGRIGPQIPQTIGPSFNMGNRTVGPLNVGDAIKSLMLGIGAS